MIIYGMSDLHGLTGFSLPTCDVLLVAGDILPDVWGGTYFRNHPEMSYPWLYKMFIPWLERYVRDGTVGHVIFTWGNHDWTIDLPRPDLPDNFYLLIDEEVEIDGVRFWGSPWSNVFSGKWCWNAEPSQLARVYDAIPPGVDVLMTHQPPWGLGGDFITRDGNHDRAGSHELVSVIDTLKPGHLVCGHIHGGYGEYQRGETFVSNVSLLDEWYRHVNKPTLLRGLEEEER